MDMVEERLGVEGVPLVGERSMAIVSHVLDKVPWRRRVEPQCSFHRRSGVFLEPVVEDVGVLNEEVLERNVSEGIHADGVCNVPHRRRTRKPHVSWATEAHGGVRAPRLSRFHVLATDFAKRFGSICDVGKEPVFSSLLCVHVFLVLMFFRYTVPSLARLRALAVQRFASGAVACVRLRVHAAEQ